MTAFTWLAIAALVLGSLSIFAWFIADVLVATRRAPRSAGRSTDDPPPR